MKKTRIIYCDCSVSGVLPGEVKGEVWVALLESGLEFVGVEDLCGVAALDEGRLAAWAGEGDLVVAACYERAVRWLFDRGGAKLSENSTVLNMREQSADEIIERLLAVGSKEDEREDGEGFQEEKTDWVPWYPVIDYGLCTNCKQCLNFCLFGVFGMSAEGKVEVQKPANCKLNCPACARVCPKMAIIFPKYDKSPINGAEVSEQEAGEKVGVEISSVLKGNVYDTLRKRQAGGKKRFAGKGETEKKVDLAKMQKELDIPDEVIASLSGDRRQETGDRKEDTGGGGCGADCDCNKLTAWLEKKVIDDSLCEGCE